MLIAEQLGIQAEVVSSLRGRVAIASVGPIMTEALGSAGTYLKEVKTQNGGKMIPFVGSSATIDPQWFQQVRDAIGIDDLLKYYGGVDLGYDFSGPAYSEFLTNLNAAA